MTYEEAYALCEERFRNNTVVADLIDDGSYDPSFNLHACAISVSHNGDVTVIDDHEDLGVSFVLFL